MSNGAKAYPTDDEIMLLFVRESARVNVWEWIQASLDPNIDLFKEQQFTGGQSPEEVRVESDADMAQSQLAAKKVALEAAGYTVPVGKGLAVLAVQPSRPAAAVLQSGDILLTIDGKELTDPKSLSDAVRAHKVGDTVELGILHDGKQKTVKVKTEAGRRRQARDRCHRVRPVRLPGRRRTSTRARSVVRRRGSR